MPEKPTIVRSVNDPAEQRCVDIFCRPDGTFGFEEYRRDPEDPAGWFAIGGFGYAVFSSESEAVAAAETRVGWLADTV